MLHNLWSVTKREVPHGCGKDKLKMKKDIKTEEKHKDGPRKTWGGVTDEHWEYLKADGEKNRSDLTVWRGRQDHLVGMAKKMLASKLDSIRLSEAVDDTEETHYRISDQLLVDYYNIRFPERKISGDALQRTRDVQKRYVENPSAAARGNDGSHSLHFDEACNLALIADVAFVPVSEQEIRRAIETKNLTTLLELILDMVRNVVDDTQDVVNAEGAEIKRTRVLHVLFCYIDEYARKLLHAEQDDMTDDEIYNRREDLRTLAHELEMAVEGYGFMVGPQRMMCMSMLNSMQTTVGLLTERTEFEAVIRDIRPNDNRQEEEKAFQKIEEALKGYCRRASENCSHDEIEDEDEDYEDDDDLLDVYDYRGQEGAALEALREELEADRHRKHED